jgi:uncharacterized C2H2 Zn-finger protein
MSRLSLRCEVLHCEFRTPDLPGYFYAQMVDQLKLHYWGSHLQPALMPTEPSAETPSNQNHRSFLMSNADDLQQQQNCDIWEEVELDDEVEDLKRSFPKKMNRETESPKCPTCTRVFPTSKGFHLHRKTCPKFPCNGCGKIFSTVGGLTFHQNKKCWEWMKTEENTSPDDPEKKTKVRRGLFACKEPNCSASYSSRHTLSQHVRVVHRGQKHACPEPGCTRLFSSFYFRSSHIWDHQRARHGKAKLFCDKPGCGKNFTYSLNFRRHVKKEHND